MLQRTFAVLLVSCILPSLTVRTASGQSAPAEDEIINTIRDQSTIGAGDQRRINEWVQAQVSKLTSEGAADASKAFLAFRERFQKELRNPKNSPAFNSQLAVQTAQVAADVFGKADVSKAAAWGLAQVLLDIDSAEAYPGLMAGLRCTAESARFLSAKGLNGQKLRESIGGNAARLTETVQALQAAGVKETSGVVLSRIYEALAYPANLPVVLPAYLAIFDARLETRRNAPGACDGAEIAAWEFFRTPAVLSALNAEQKAQLVRRLGVFLRLNAERFHLPSLSETTDYKEVVALELSLDAEEELIATLTGASAKGGKIREQLEKSGFGSRGEILQQAYRWVGQPGGESGALNEAPWNVAPGAP